MTEINKTIEVKATPERVWSFMDIRTWPEVSPVFVDVKINTKEFRLKTQADVVAGAGKEKVHYKATIKHFTPHEQLVYERTGGPLPGTSEWHIEQNSTKIIINYTNRYHHLLAEPVVQSLSDTMERFLGDLREAIESGK